MYPIAQKTAKLYLYTTMQNGGQVYAESKRAATDFLGIEHNNFCVRAHRDGCGIPAGYTQKDSLAFTPLIRSKKHDCKSLVNSIL